MGDAVSLHPPRRHRVRHTTSGLIERRDFVRVCTNARCPKALERQDGTTCAGCVHPVKELPR